MKAMHWNFINRIYLFEKNDHVYNSTFLYCNNNFFEIFISHSNWLEKGSKDDTMPEKSMWKRRIYIEVEDTLVFLFQCKLLYFLLSILSWNNYLIKNMPFFMNSWYRYLLLSEEIIDDWKLKNASISKKKRNYKEVKGK